ncbi:hypothetical protein GCM10011495_30970 [Hymenobacter frigidus]|uniref:DUF4280 domain-containing protein n=1 Tax=Hymenobacter frigidus TaxID=1524095 RepID=A0ABQ2ADV8_9BACT|nr:hypothetical protein [Hymenobacter frigidus]GGH88819.1 hypothetical protein GCM10011495_30970 [Hymenobacter frigidus]
MTKLRRKSSSLRILPCQAPLSHYMMHFQMVDKAVVVQGNGQTKACCGGVVVAQCNKRHQTTAWNDLKGVGYYKHH